MSDGRRDGTNKYPTSYVRAFQLLENCFSSFPLSAGGSGSSGGGFSVSGIQVGDVVYSDMSYGKADAYDGSKEAVGVVTWVSEDGASAKIINLKNLTVSDNADGNQEFDPANPYSGSRATMKWQNSAYYDSSREVAVGTEITNIQNYYWTSNPNIYSAIAQHRGAISVSNTEVEALSTDAMAYQTQFNAVMGAYDDMIVDAGYQGVNLLNGGSLNVTFNEERTHSYTVQGYNATSAALGVNAANWSNLADVKASIAQLQGAIGALRGFAEQLGNSYGIIETRMNFTDALADVLETGADDLVLADMNEESANYLALQTRQQLAVNSLALASQSAQSVLRLF